MEEKPKTKTFKEKYQEDPEFKKKHNEYINEKIKCDCGKMVKRVAMAKHKRTKVHARLIKESQEKTTANMEEMIEKLLKEKMKQILLG